MKRAAALEGRLADCSKSAIPGAMRQLAWHAHAGWSRSPGSNLSGAHAASTPIGYLHTNLQCCRMPSALNTFVIFVGAALAEIAGCFAFWAWLRQGRSIFWLAPGVVSLTLFAYLLTLLPSDHAGRAYAAYGGIYIVASLFWLWLAEGQKPDLWDIAGGSVAILAALIILFAPRST